MSLWTAASPQTGQSELSAKPKSGLDNLSQGVWLSITNTVLA